MDENFVLILIFGESCQCGRSHFLCMVRSRVRGPKNKEKRSTEFGKKVKIKLF